MQMIEHIRNWLPVKSDGLFLGFGWGVAPWLSIAVLLAVVALFVRLRGRPLSLYGFFLGAFAGYLAALLDAEWLWEASPAWLLACAASAIAAVVAVNRRGLSRLAFAMAALVLLWTFCAFAFVMALAAAAAC